MTACTIEPFTEDHIAAAGELLARRHRNHREVEPLLPQRFEDPAEARTQVAEAWSRPSAAGAVAVRDGDVVGYLIGSPKSDDVWGANEWVEQAGHAVAEAELIRDLYAHVAGPWVEAGRTRHYVVVPASDAASVDAWFRLSFGVQQAYGIREVPETAWPGDVREATADDVDGSIELGPLVELQHTAPPTFAQLPDESDEDLRQEIEREIASPEIGSLVAERDGRLAGGVIVSPAEDNGKHTGLAGPDDHCVLQWQATRPELRGTGIGRALTDGAFAWAHDHGYATIVADWRVPNLLASRFWPRRGFRTSFLRLYRSIP
jgi:ribosomal protein S18 acetylase RimI-like enzyme